MFEDTKESIEAVRKSLAESEQVIRSISKDSTELDRQLKNARARLLAKRSNSRGEAIANKIVKGMIKEEIPVTILKKSIADAVSTSREFNTEFYRSALNFVAEQKEIYKMLLSGAGWNVHLFPQIVFESVAGTLQDYARGIKAYRASLKTKVGAEGTSFGQKATEYWLSKVYSTALEARTVDGRIGVSGRAAPFFQLLDSGSQPLASDRPDASYNPFPQAPTGFINDAEREIQKSFNSKYILATSKEFETAALLEGEIDKATEYRDKIRELVNSISTDERKNRSVYTKLASIAKYINSGKLNLSIDKYAPEAQ